MSAAPCSRPIDRWQASVAGRRSPKRATTSRASSRSQPPPSTRLRCGRPISAFRAAGVSAATIRPAAMIPSRSASWSASSRYCVVRKTVVPSSRRRRTSSHSVRREVGSRPVVGSSRNRTSGSWMSAIARSRRRRMPPEYVPTRRSAAWLRPTRSMSSAPRARTARGAMPCRVACSSISSLPVMSGSSAASCSATPIRRRTSRGLRGDVEAGDAGVAAGRAQQRDEHPHRRRLAGAVGAEESVDLAGRDREVDAVDGPHAALELAFQSDDFDRCDATEDIARATSFCGAWTQQTTGCSC